MKTFSLGRFENLTRIIALSGSVITALIFGIGFAMEEKIPYQIEQVLLGQEKNLGLPIYLCLLLTVFIGYVLAGKKQFATSGGMLTLGAVGAVYAWCQIGLHLSPGPYLIVLACPALFHLLALMLHRQSLRRELDPSQNETVSYA